MLHFDRLEQRSVASREMACFRELRAILGIARSRAPSLRAQLKSVSIEQIKSRADLAQIPVLRARHMCALQAEKPPFGGLLATRMTSLARIMSDADGRLHPEGRAKDWWGAARALYAAGFSKNDVVLNPASGSTDIAGQILASGIHALGGVTLCVNPRSPQDFITRTQANGYIGSLTDLQILAPMKAQQPFDKAVITGSRLSAASQSSLSAVSRNIHQMYLRPEIGVVAYQATETEVLICNEGLIVEIVAPGTDIPLPLGHHGEIVITRLNGDYPLLRFGTGDLSTLRTGISPCGRTNYRLDAQITSTP